MKYLKEIFPYVPQCTVFTLNIATDKREQTLMTQVICHTMQLLIRVKSIALDKLFFFQSKSTDIFLISPQKHMLWVLIRSALVRRF